jgi:hypothetical protein
LVRFQDRLELRERQFDDPRPAPLPAGAFVGIRTLISGQAFSSHGAVAY